MHLTWRTPKAPFGYCSLTTTSGILGSLRELIEGQRELSVVGTATNGLTAIELVDELAPDAAVLDLHMPLLDGVSTVARLRRDHPSLCLIALTGDEAPALHRAPVSREPTTSC